MKTHAISVVKPAIPYGALVGRVILTRRKRLHVDQAEMAKALRITQSAYSRLEHAQSAMSLPQLKMIAGRLGATPSELLREADALSTRLRSQGVEITNESVPSPAAVLVALGILAALILSRK